LNGYSLGVCVRRSQWSSAHDRWYSIPMYRTQP